MPDSVDQPDLDTRVGLAHAIIDRIKDRRGNSSNDNRRSLCHADSIQRRSRARSIRVPIFFRYH